MENFTKDIKEFNSIYEIESNDYPTFIKNRFRNFIQIFEEEVKEGEELLKKYGDNVFSEHTQLHFFTELSDWLGDMVIYIFSEARRWGLPMDNILDIIMRSNFSKLDKKGNPIKDSRGKVLKGDNFFPPEPELEKMLRVLINKSENVKELENLSEEEGRVYLKK